MSDRYRPRDLKRAAAKLWADPNHAVALQQQRERELRDRIDDRQRAGLSGGARVIECRHGVSWLTCTLCSKARSR